MEVRVIGIDIAKRYFQIHGVDVAGDVVLRRKLSRDAFLRAVSGLAESGFPREAEGRSLQHRFGFVRVPWPDPIRRICANAW
jgi:hypothetical protein